MHCVHMIGINEMRRDKSCQTLLRFFLLIFETLINESTYYILIEGLDRTRYLPECLYNKDIGKKVCFQKSQYSS